MGWIYEENIYLTGGTQVRVPMTRHKCHHLRHEKILNGYDDFNTYFVVGSLRARTNFGCLDIWRHVVTLEASKVVSRLSHNNKEYDSIINPLLTVFSWILRTVIVTNQKTTVIQNSKNLCTQRSWSIVLGYNSKHKNLLIPFFTVKFVSLFYCSLPLTRSKD